jgi:hypothetical protein
VTLSQQRKGGITWCITRLLSLSANQKAKINIKASQHDGTIHAIHLDEFTTDAKRQGICQRLNALSHRSALAVLILCSPQALNNRKIYRLLFKKLCENTSYLSSVSTQFICSYSLCYFSARNLYCFSIMYSNILSHPRYYSNIFEPGRPTNKTTVKLQPLPENQSSS